MKGYLLLAYCLLVGCSLSGGSPVSPESVSGGKSATIVLDALAKGPAVQARPGGVLGVFTTMYLAQGTFLPSASAVRGVRDILRIVHDQEKPLSDESFALLQTLGDILSVDLFDLLNRSPNRIESLDRYTESLTNADAATKSKLEEIAAALKVLAAQKKERRTIVSDLMREQKATIAAKDYSTAARQDEELLAARTRLSETEFTESQSKDMQGRFVKLLDIAEKRKAAIEKNRELLLAGLRVSDLPGLEDLGILEKKATRR